MENFSKVYIQVFIRQSVFDILFASKVVETSNIT